MRKLIILFMLTLLANNAIAQQIYLACNVVSFFKSEKQISKINFTIDIDQKSLIVGESYITASFNYGGLQISDSYYRISGNWPDENFKYRYFYVTFNRFDNTIFISQSHAYKNSSSETTREGKGYCYVGQQWKQQF
jgi:hypothetical protein